MFRFSEGPSKFFWLLSLLCVIETLCFTYLQIYDNLHIAVAILYFVAGLGICAVAFYVAIKNSEPGQPVVFNPIWGKYLKAALILGSSIYLVVLLAIFANRLFVAHPINYRESDMLPLIKTAAERWLQGQKVYTPVKEVWNGEEIPYLSGMWLPFTLPVALQVDMRYTTIGAMVLASIILFGVLGKANLRTFLFAFPVFFLLLFLLVKFHTWQDFEFFVATEEMVPAFFYLLLFMGIAFKKDWLTGIMLGLCLISRFSVVFFLPFGLLWFVLSKQYKSLLKIGAAAFTVVMVLFVIPYFMGNPKYFWDVTLKYTGDIEGYWQAHNYALSKHRGLGLAYVFGYENRQWLNPIGYSLQVIMLSAWAGIGYWLTKRGNLNREWWLMGGLKLSLLIFYNFINRPYFYLFMVPTIISYTLLLAILLNNNLKQKATNYGIS